jgi:hypothetical protein
MDCWSADVAQEVSLSYFLLDLSAPDFERFDADADEPEGCSLRIELLPDPEEGR